MRILSATSQLLDSALKAILRFPYVFMCSATASALGVFLVHYNDTVDPLLRDQIGHYALIAGLGISLFISSHLYAERKGSFIQRFWPMFASVAILALCYLDFRHFYEMRNDEGAALRFFGYLLGVHLIAAFFPVRNKRNSNAVWQYNRVLFLRTNTTAVYTGVLYAGLAGAILAVDTLFSMQFDERIYADLWMCMAGFGSSLIFTAGLPKDICSLEDNHELPKGLSVFAAYILLPLVVIYGIILYAYEGKIIANWSLPEGWVSYLIMAFSVVGILALLLLHPYGQNEEKPWINRYTRNYYFALYPLLILLFVAALVRIDQYGFTVLRYSLLALAIWLAFIAIYMPLTRNRHIAMVPMSLLTLLVIAWFFPGTNAWSISVSSQKARLEKELTQLGLWDANKQQLMAGKVALNDSTSMALFEQFDYLLDKHGPNALKPFMAIPDSATTNGDYVEEKRRRYSRYMAQSYMENELQKIGLSRYSSFDVAEAVPVEAFELNASTNLQSLTAVPKGNWAWTTDVSLDNLLYLNTVHLEFDSAQSVLFVYQGSKTWEFPVLETAKKRIGALKYRPYTNERYKLGNQGLIFSQDGCYLDIKDIDFQWTDQRQTWSIKHLNGSLWLAQD